MQIIDELEVARRGPYGGGIGHVSFTGEGQGRGARSSSGAGTGASLACLLAPHLTAAGPPGVPLAACEAGTSHWPASVPAGGMDMALALRTMVIPTAADDTMYSYAGERPRREWVVHLQARLGRAWAGRGWLVRLLSRTCKVGRRALNLARRISQPSLQAKSCCCNRCCSGWE